MAGGAVGAVELLPVRPSILGTIRDAWRQRSLFRPLAVRILTKQFAKTKIGPGWLVLRPFMDAIGMSLLFGGVLGVATKDGTPYLLFFVVGVSVFRGCERMILWMTRSFDRNAKFTRKFDMPLLLVPLSGATPAIVEFFVYMGIVAIAVAYYLLADGQLYLQIGLPLLEALAGLSMIALIGFGIGLFTSVWAAHTRDVRLGLRYFLQIWIVVTPVLYPLSKLPKTVADIAQYNPITPPLAMWRHGLIGSGPPIETAPLLASIGMTVLLVLGGLYFFSRQATNFMGPAGWGRGGRDADDDDDDDDDVL
jgi:lipopolysaccharide transport system permease protein